MAHRIYQVTSFAQLGSYRLRVEFNDVTSQEIDFAPVLRGELYGPLQDPALFAQVRIDPESKTLVWPNGADFDPETLHDWPERGPELAELAKEWKRGTG